MIYNNGRVRARTTRLGTVCISAVGGGAIYVTRKELADIAGAYAEIEFAAERIDDCAMTERETLYVAKWYLDGALAILQGHPVEVYEQLREAAQVLTNEVEHD